jgi:hypothetical protein
LQPYVIKRGDHLALLAHKFRFDADTVWNDPKNAQLRRYGDLSQDPNILYPSDMLYIPDQNLPPVMMMLTMGTTNTFVSDAPPTVTVIHAFVGDHASTYASKACTIEELDHLTGLATDPDGILTFEAPVTLKTATVVFSNSGESWALSIGLLDPIHTLTGVFQRLQNLGCIGQHLSFDPGDLDLIRAGLVSLKAAQPHGGDRPPNLAPTDAPASESTPAPDSGPPWHPAGASPAGRGTGAASAAAPRGPGGWPDPLPASTPSPGDPGVDPAPTSSQNASVKNAGLADDGTLDAETRSLLLNAYGC